MPTPREREANEVLSVESTLTSRGQTTIPRPTRRARKLSPSEKVRFSLRGDDTVVITRVTIEPRDPLVGAFLDLIEADAPPVVNGWRLYAHGLFLEQLEALVADAERARRRDPQNYVRSHAAKRLAVITKLAFDVIPQDPTRAAVRQGDTLGGEVTHWFRAVFFQQYRLFFRYGSDDKTIIYVWVNDDRSRRAYGSKTDAYEVFRRMLTAGDPPDTWEQLLSHATRNTRRLRRAAPAGEPDH